MGEKRYRGSKKARGRLWIAAVVALLGLAVAATSGTKVDAPVTERDPDMVALGQELYSATCAACHGPNLEGTDTGPTFIDPVYAPNHHGDEAFQRAVLAGTPAHHWPFGPMPPQVGLDREAVGAIVQFVRAQQEAAGVFTDPTH